MWSIDRTEEIVEWIKSLDDDAKEAILLVGGDKKGDKRFYKKMIPIADSLYEKYLLKKGREK